MPPNNENGISLTMVVFLTVKGDIKAVSPMINDILIKFEPIIFPMDMPSVPLIAADMLTAASGELVPKATMVKPIIMGGIFKYLAIFDAHETKKSAPFISRMNPITNKT